MFEKELEIDGDKLVKLYISIQNAILETIKDDKLWRSKGGGFPESLLKERFTICHYWIQTGRLELGVSCHRLTECMYRILRTHIDGGDVLSILTSKIYIPEYSQKDTSSRILI